jgi:septal ring factor EnvC (AmiA/AmiB activator)
LNRLRVFPPRRWTTRIVGGLLLALPLLPAIAAEPDDPAQAKKALDAVVEQLNALDRWMNDAEKQRVRWERDVQEKDREVAAVAKSVEEASRALKSIEREIDTLAAEQRALEARRAEQAERIGEHLAASYRISGQDFLKLLLNQESPDTFERMARYHRYFTNARLDALDDYRTTLDDLADNRFQLETRAEEARDQQKELKAREGALVKERRDRQDLISELDREMEGKTSERERLIADRNRLEQLFAELSRRATELDGTAFVARKGNLPWPLKGRVTNAFGQSRADGRLTWHGMLIAAEEGTEVKSVFRGRVVFANWLRGFGLLTIIDHGGGFMTLYGHADVLLKTVGDWTEGGEVIARAGKSGGQQRSGLYFEVRQKGAAKDPIGWLQRR